MKTAVSLAEASCVSTVSYSWKKEDESGQKSEIYNIVYSRGGTEDEARATLSIKTRRSQAEAFKMCQRTHETISLCVSERIKQARNAINLGSFNSRRALEGDIKLECTKSLGSCLSTEASPPECYIPPTPTPASPSSGADQSTPATKDGEKK